MGDRGNIVVRQGTTPADDVWFYTHWSGYRIGEVVREALAKQWRWNDESYLARIIFDVLTERHQGEETSFGISTRIGDNEYPILVVDVPRQKVWKIEESQLQKGRIPRGFHMFGEETSFADYVKQPAAKEA